MKLHDSTFKIFNFLYALRCHFNYIFNNRSKHIHPQEVVNVTLPMMINMI